MKINELFLEDKDFQNLIGSNAWKCGCFSRVYDLGEYVLKGYTLDNGYDLFLKFIESYKGETPHLPKIHDIVEISDGKWVLLEKLNPLWEHKEDYVSRLTNAEEAGWYERDIQPWLGISDTLDNALYALEDFGGNALDNQTIEWDLHEENIMLRGDELVIIDPWG